MKIFATSLILAAILIFMTQVWGEDADSKTSPSSNNPATSAATKKPEGLGGKVSFGNVSFSNDVMPLFDRLGCSTSKCHGATQGQGGLKLSMFGADPRRDFEALTRCDQARRINLVEPEKSLLLQKAIGALEHGGKQRIQPKSPQYDVFLSWLASGAKWDDANVPKIVSIAVEPKSQTLGEKQSEQLAVTATFSNGMHRNVTHDAVYRTTDDSVVHVDADGKFEAKGLGQAYLIATYNRRSAVVRVAVPQHLTTPFPKAEAFNKIDELVLDKLKELGIPPSGLASDQEFMRRVYLDVIGTLPTPKEVRDFLADANPQKRSQLIDRLLSRGEFADYWALKWGDLLRIKAEYPSNLWPNAVQTYHYWVRQAIAGNMPYDQFARELLVSSGCNFRAPPANYYRAVKKRDPQGFAESTALVFMGARIGCASCHGHPTESWTLDDNLGMAAFFSQIKFKSTKEWKEEIVYVDPAQVFRDPRTRNVLTPKPLDSPAMTIAPGVDSREKFAEWLTSPKNPWFAKNISNRIWFWLLGRGIVHEPDDLRATNPPSNPALLDYLEKELVDHKYDQKHIFRLILNSATYQRSSTPIATNQHDLMFGSHYVLKRLPAEVLSDALGQVTQSWDTFASQIPEPYSRWPNGFHATQLADGSVGTPFLELFGRPPRDTAYESDRDCKTSMRQSLYMITSSEIENKVNRSPRIKQWMKDNTPNDAVVDELFLWTVSRLPTSEEKQKAIEHLAKDPKKRELALQDLLWALLNTKEFAFNH